MSTSFPGPFPEEIILHIGRILARDRQSSTLVSLLSTSSCVYDLLLRTLYQTIFVNDRSATFFHDLVSEAFRRDPNMTYGVSEKTVLSIPFGSDKVASDKSPAPQHRTSALRRAELIHALVIEESALLEAYKRCSLSWFVPPDRPTMWPALLPTLEVINLPSNLIRAIAERSDGLPAHIVPDQPEPFIKWMEWRAPFQAFCEGLRLLSPSKTRLCVHLSHVEDTESVSPERADIVRDAQTQLLGTAMQSFGGHSGCRTAVYGGLTPTTTLDETSTIAVDILAILRSMIGQCGKQQLFLRNAADTSCDHTQQQRSAYDERVNYDIDHPDGLPNQLSEALWSFARHRSRTSGKATLAQHDWTPTKVQWRSLYKTLQSHVILLPPNQTPEDDHCNYCRCDW